ncbi:MAG: hypothetical protein ABIQ55_08360 [Gemmatimonadaceae bacterium]
MRTKSFRFAGTVLTTIALAACDAPADQKAATPAADSAAFPRRSGSS